MNCPYCGQPVAATYTDKGRSVGECYAHHYFLLETKMIKLGAASRLKAAEEWSQEVTEDVTKHPKEGTFKGSAASIAKELKRLHPDLKGAMSALNFYINRAGDDVPNKANLEKAKDELRKAYD